MDWVEYFRLNRENRVSVPPGAEVSLDPRLRELLVRSLQRFQKGESGDGAHLRGVAARTGDPAYEEAVLLFVREEQVHADLMARCIEAMGGELLRRHWSDALFRLSCLVSGLRAELMVILVAETIALRFFSALHKGTGDPVLRAVFAQIGQDERGHIAFHCDTLRPAISSLPAFLKGPLRLAWKHFFRLALLLVVYDHGPLLWEMGLSSGAFWRECTGAFDAVQEFVFAPLPRAQARPVEAR
jgi:hypothetical protein